MDLMKPQALRPAVAAVVLGSTALAAGSASLSFFVIPRLLASESAAHMVRQWHCMYVRTRALFRSGFWAVAVGYALLAFRSRQYAAHASTDAAAAAFTAVDAKALHPDVPGRVAAWKLLAGAAALCATITPYTLGLVRPLNRRLVALKDDPRLAAAAAAAAATEAQEGTVHAESAEGAEARRLVDRWGLYNLARGALAGTASVLGMTALLKM